MTAISNVHTTTTIATTTRAVTVIPPVLLLFLLSSLLFLLPITITTTTNATNTASATTLSRLISCGSAESVGKTTLSLTDGAGNELEVICNKRSTVTLSPQPHPHPLFSHAEAEGGIPITTSVIRFEAFLHPAAAAATDPLAAEEPSSPSLMIGFCPYVFGYNTWYVDYDDGNRISSTGGGSPGDGDFSKLYWRSYDIPSSVVNLDIDPAHGITLEDIATTDFFFDVGEGKLTKIVSNGTVTIKEKNGGDDGWRVRSGSDYEFLRHDDFVVHEVTDRILLVN